MAPKSILWFCFTATVFLLSCITFANGLAVMSIDLGSEWMKIGIVSPGVPMEIVLNKESKRKTPVSIAFRDGERTFGEDAQVVGVRFPQNNYMYVLDLLGKTMDNPIVQLYQERFPHYKIVADPERKIAVFQHDSETQYSPEELVSMMFAKAKEYAETFAQQKVSEAVITAPPFFGQAERRSVLKAADLAGLKVLQLINSNTAAALNYGIFRRKDFNETAQTILFYDMGASSSVATVASYHVAKTKERGYSESHPQVSILGVGYDRTLGGLEMQIRLRDHLAREFNAQKKTANDVFKNARAMAKLFKEAGRVKNVLSANAEHYAQVEGLLDEKDFRLKVTRETLEKLSEDLFPRIKGPIERALAAAKMDMSQVQQVILVGAGTRVPKVQEKLTEFVGKDLGKSLNTDEAPAMGAVYKAADLSTGFQVKKFITKDTVIFPIEVDFERELDPDEEGRQVVKVVKRTLFPVSNPYPQKKVLTFNKHTEDFHFFVGYANLSHLPESEIPAVGSMNISRVELTGIVDALQKHAGETTEFKGIKAHFSVDDSGLLSLSYAEALFEKVQQPLEEASTPQSGVERGEGLYKGSEMSSEVQEASEESPFAKLGETLNRWFASNEEKPEAVNATEEAADNRTEDKNASKAEKAEKKPKIIAVKEDLIRKQTTLDVKDLEGELFESALKRIVELDEIDRKRREKEIARNSFESYLLDVQDKMSQDEYLELVTEEDKTKIQEKASLLSDWLYEEGDDAEAVTFNTKLAELQSLAGPMYERAKERENRPEVVAAYRQMLNATNHFFGNIMNTSEEERYLSQKDIDGLEKMINDAETWLDGKLKAQEALPKYETPVLTARAMAEKMSELDRTVKSLVGKAKMARNKKLKEMAEKLKEEMAKKSTNKTVETKEKKEADEEDKAANNEDVKLEGQETETQQERAEEPLDENKRNEEKDESDPSASNDEHLEL